MKTPVSHSETGVFRFCIFKVLYMSIKKAFSYYNKNMRMKEFITASWYDFKLIT